MRPTPSAPALLLATALAACAGAPPPPTAVVTIPSEATKQAEIASPAPAPEDGPVPVTALDPSLGEAGALVTVVELGDFSNPFCAQHEPWIRELQQRYAPELVRFVWKAVPDDRPESQAVARAALAVFVAGGSEAFWSFYDQAASGYPDVSRAHYEEWASRALVKQDLFNRAFNSPALARALEQNQAMARELDVHPPQFLVNGVLVQSISSLDALTQAIDRELASTKDLVAGGFARDKVYARRTRENLEAKAGRTKPGSTTPNPPADKGISYGAKHLLIMYYGARRAPANVTRSKAEAFALALQALRKLRAGKPFADAVKEYSDEPGAAARGGDLGHFKKGQMVPEFEQELEKTPVGKLSDVVETPFGYHIILRTE